MSDTDGSPQRDDRHYRWSRSRSPVSPGCTGETLAECEERRLAEAAVPVGQPAGPPWAASTDSGLSTRGPAPAEETAPAVQAASPAAPPREGAPGAQGAETAAPTSRAASPTAAPGAPPARGGGPWHRPRASPRGLPRRQRGAEQVHKEPPPPPRPATPRPPARHGRGGRTPRGPRAPRPEPPQPRRVAGSA